LADGEEDEEGEGEVVEHEFGRGSSVECLNPASKVASHSHGLEDSIYPLEVNSVIGMEEVEAYQKTRLLVVLEVEDGGPNCKATIKNTTASD
jgi:hypothetical protein